MARPDVLLVSLGTTLGWRVADRMLVEQLERAGATTEAVSIGRGAADRLRRGYPVNDLVEMYAARRTVRDGRRAPRAARADRVLHHRGDAAALAADALRGPLRRPRPPEPARCAERVPARARAARHAPRAGHDPVQRRGRARRCPTARRARSWCRRRSTRRSDSPPAEREPLAVAYVPDPKAKGLDVLVGGWAAAAVEGARLAVYGLDPEWARSHLRRTGHARAGLARAAGHGPGRRVPRRAAPRARVRPRRALGGLGPGAARGARRRRPARHGSGGRPLRGPSARPAAGRPARRRADRPGGARSGHPRGVRHDRRRASAPTGSARPSCSPRTGRRAVQEIVARELLPALFADAPR